MKPIAATYRKNSGNREEEGAVLQFINTKTDLTFEKVMVVFMTKRGHLLIVHPSEITIMFPQGIISGVDL